MKQAKYFVRDYYLEKKHLMSLMLEIENIEALVLKNKKWALN